MMEWTVTLIPLLPLAAFLALALSGGRMGPQSHRITLPLMFASFVLSLVTLFWVTASGPIAFSLYSLINAGDLKIDVGFYVDPLAAFILVLVTGVSTLVHRFSSRYMQGDLRYSRFFALLSLFPFAMLMLVMSSNLLVLYVFWEIMGICSFLLISHSAERMASCVAALRVFLINAVADVGLGLGVLLVFNAFGTLDIREVLAAAPDYADRTVDLLSPILGGFGFSWEVDLLTVIALLFFFGAMGKSAQFPFHVWLPFAMEAPTPVSALIHAATLVKAGIYLMIRLGPLLVLAPAAMNVIAIVGGLTALVGAVIALTQSDVKRNLAYSTISQLGFMMFACGIGAFVAALFHLLAHGVLKAFLFLSAGSALQSLDRHAPGGHDPPGKTVSHSLFLSGLALAVLPPVLLVFSGYGTLWASTSGMGQTPMYGLFLAGASLFSGMYLYRAVTKISPYPRQILPVFLVSAVAVALLSAVLMILFQAFSTAITPVLMGDGGRGDQRAWLVLGIGMAWSGVFLAYGLRKLAVLPMLQRTAWYKRGYVLIYNKGYLDEIIDAWIVPPILRLSKGIWQGFDLRLLDRGTQAAAAMTVRISRWLWRSVDIRLLGSIIEGLARLMIGVARWLWQSVDLRGLERMIGMVGRQNRATGEVLHRIEPSMLQHHLLVTIFTLVALMVLFLVFFR